MMDQTRHVFHTTCNHFWVPLSLPFLYVFICKVGYVDAQIRELYYTSRGLTSLPLWENVTQ